MAQTGAEVEKFHDVQVVSVPATIVTSHTLVEGGLSLVSCLVQSPGKEFSYIFRVVLVFICTFFARYACFLGFLTATRLLQGWHGARMLNGF